MTDTPTPAVNPLLIGMSLPGETVRLPSGGLLYKNGELADDIVDGELHVHPMTTIDEITMKSPDKLFSGDAVREIFARCIPGIQKVDDIFAQDIDFLMIALRKISYGAEIEVRYNHECGTEDKPSTDQSYVVNVDNYIREAVVIDATMIKSKYKLELETGQIVTFQPMRFKHVVDTMQMTDDQLSPIEQQSRLFDMILAVIHDVNSVTDRNFLVEWLTALPASTVQNIFDHIENVSDWGVKQELKTVCKDCGEPIVIPAQVNQLNFFI